MADGSSAVFDDRHPPDRALVEDCVHCGFCLPACPTYALWGEEMDSPRGRIQLIALGLDGTARLDARYLQHFDACLGCLACVTACPSGVQYEPLLEATRAQLERRAPRRVGDRLFRRFLLTVFPSPWLLRLAAVLGWVYRRTGLRRLLAPVVRRLPERVRALDALLPDAALADAWARLPPRVAAEGEQRLRVGFLPGCVQAVFFRAANEATLRVLAAEGVEVAVPDDAGCCGALGSHAGYGAHARARAKRTIAAFEALDVAYVVVSSAGCGSAMKHYDRLLEDDPGWRDRAAAFAARVRDSLELVASLTPRARRGEVRATVAYHDACHLAHGQGIRDAPRALLAAIPGLEVREVADAGLCCGSAGVYNLVEPSAAQALGERKAAQVRDTGADTLAAANPGCLLQLDRHLGDAGVRLAHPIELLDRAIAAGRGDPR